MGKSNFRNNDCICSSVIFNCSLAKQITYAKILQFILSFKKKIFFLKILYPISY